MPETKKRRSRAGIWFGLGLVLVVAAVAAGVRYSRRDKPILIQTEKVQRRDLTEVVVASGRIQPVVQVKISPEVSGEITELPVKEGQVVKKGDLLVKIKPDYYLANRRSAEAAFKSAEAGKALAEANLAKAESEFKRNQALVESQLVSESVFIEVKTALDVARASKRTAEHQVDVARAALDRATEELSKTTIFSPIDGTVSRLNSQAGERVVGTAMMTGTEIMTVADLDVMEARVDISEIDVVLIEVGQKARLEVDAFRDRKIAGSVTEIANSSRNADRAAAGGGGNSQSQEATRFEVRIRVNERAAFRPGMTVNAEIETRSRTNVLTVPIQSVTTRLPKAAGTNEPVAGAPLRSTNQPGSRPGSPGKGKEENKPIEVVFVRTGDSVHAQPVKRGISDDNYTEIVEGLAEGQEIVSGGYKAISRDLEEGKKVALGTEPGAEGTEVKK